MAQLRRGNFSTAQGEEIREDFRVDDKILNFFSNRVDSEIGSPYNPHIDGGAANEQRTKSFLRLLNEKQPPGWVVGTMKHLRNWAKARRRTRMRCLTIESEERETWTAEVLADRLDEEGNLFPGQSMRHSDGHVF